MSGEDSKSNNDMASIMEVMKSMLSDMNHNINNNMNSIRDDMNSNNDMVNARIESLQERIASRVGSRAASTLADQGWANRLCYRHAKSLCTKGGHINDCNHQEQWGWERLRRWASHAKATEASGVHAHEHSCMARLICCSQPSEQPDTAWNIHSVEGSEDSLPTCDSKPQGLLRLISDSVPFEYI